MKILRSRKFLTGLLLSGLTSTLLIQTSRSVSIAQQVAQPSAKIVVKQPNEFVLTTGKETFITYSTPGQDGVPQLDYKTQTAEHKFSGNEIETLHTEIGTLLTVIIDRPKNPDIGGNEVKLTLLLPIVNLLVSKEDPVVTEAILTTQKIPGNIRRPLLGQIQTYEVLPLKGTAYVH